MSTRSNIINYLKAFIDVAKIRLAERDIAETKENDNERDS